MAHSLSAHVTVDDGLKPGDWTVPFIRDFFKRLSYEAPPVNDCDQLQAAVQVEVESWGLGDDAKGVLSVISPATGLIAFCYHHHDWNAQVYLALMASLLLWVDDTTDTDFRFLTEFHQRLYAQQPQLHPCLSSFISVMKRAYEFYEPIAADTMILGATAALTGWCIEQKINAEDPMELSKGAEDWPYYVRDKTGIAPFFAYGLFEASKFPNLRDYIQAIPDIMKFMNLANDILSSYKEEARGELATYLRTTAAIQQLPVQNVMGSMIDDTVHAHDRAREMLHEMPEALKIFDDMVKGYLLFHLKHPRYKLGAANVLE